MSGKALIRLSEPRDAAGVQAIYAPFVELGWVSFESVAPTVAEMEARMLGSRNFPWLICEVEGRVVGYAYASAHRQREAYQWSCEVSVYLHPDFQGQGLAEALYTSLFAICELQGYRNFLAGIALPNEKSLRFHQKMGFALVGTYHRVGWKEGDWRDVAWLERFVGKTKTPPGRIFSLEEVIYLPEYRTALAAGMAKIRL